MNLQPEQKFTEQPRKSIIKEEKKAASHRQSVVPLSTEERQDCFNSLARENDEMHVSNMIVNTPTKHSEQPDVQGHSE